MKRALIAQISILVVLAIAVLASNAGAFDTYSSNGGSTGNCADCHGAFSSGPNPYLSQHDGVAWRNGSGMSVNIHDGHRTFMLKSDCNVCHMGTARTPVYTYQSNGGTGFQPIGCTGCHVGDGLRAHHVNSGAATCYDCHSPGTPPAENVPPPYYFTPDTAHPNKPTDPCNANGSESLVAPPLGLDNDGNLLYDQNDPACKPAAAVLSVSPTTLTFGNQNVGSTSTAQTVTMSNTGSATLNVSGITNSNTTDFSVTSPTTPFTIAAGASQTFTVAFKPGSTGAKTATVSVTSDGGNASVSASGTGTTAPAPVLSVSPTSLTFASQTVGTTSAAQTVTISNTGTGTLNVSSISSSSTEFAFSPSTISPIAAGGSATLSVTFAPSSAGAKTATISITSDGGSASVSVSGTATAANVTVPNVVGMTQSAASSAITGAGLTVGTVTTQSSSTVPSGQVISQNPAAGASVASGSAVNLVVSSGPANVTVPNVVGMTQSAASSAITGAGLTVGTVTTQSSSTVPSGQVISQNPAAGASVASGSAVNLVVSSGGTTGSGGDVSLVRLMAPGRISLNSSRSVQIDAIGTSTVKQDATVALAAAPGAGVTVSIEHPSIHEDIGARHNQNFEFDARISCTKKGTWPVVWTATISAAQNTNTSNDTKTVTTQVTCSGGDHRDSRD